MTNFVAAHGARVVDNGFRILPIEPGKKSPGRYHDGRWTGLCGWSGFCERAPTDGELEAWSRWPDAGIGVACGNVVAIDIDVVDADLAIRLEDLAREMLGDTPAVRIGLAPKRLLVYRAETPFRGIKRHPVEVLAHGQQFVAFAVHPKTGRPYEWPNEALADLDIEDLPAITEEQARAFLDAAETIVPADQKPSSLPDVGEHRATNNDLRGTPDAVEAALQWIPNSDLHYDDWLRIGMAIKGSVGEDGADLFAGWSARSQKDQPDFTQKTWESLRPRSIGAGTIYALAQENGWVPDSSLTLNGRMADLPEVELADRLLEQANEPAPGTPEPKRGPCPIDLENLDGVLGDLVRYTLETARRPQPVLAVGAALCALGALMGRKYRTESNLRSNLYVVGIADSGSGKNHSREIINELFLHAGVSKYLGGNKIASGAGLLSALTRHPSLLFQLDEFGMFMSAAADRKRSPRHLTEIIDNLTEIYTAAGSIFLGAEYADQKAKPRQDINEPCLCVYGTTTPGHFWSALQGANVVDGSLARFLIMQSEDDYPAENDAVGIRIPPQGLIAGLKSIAAGAKDVGNLVGTCSGPEVGTDPLTVPLSAEAKVLFADLRAEVTEQLRTQRGTGFNSILARVVEMAWKIAMIRAVAAAPMEPVIREIDARWAIGIVRYCTETTMIEVEKHVSDNPIEAAHKRVLNIIRDAGEKGVTKSQLYGKTRFVDRRTRNDILDTLVDCGEVEISSRRTATKPVIVFSVCWP